MFRASSAHLQEDTVVHVQHMVLSLSMSSWWSVGTQINLLKPNDKYVCRTAALTSRRYILNIYSTNIHTEYFKRAA